MEQNYSQWTTTPSPIPEADLQVIRDVLSVQHVPVLSSLHWEKLQIILHSICDRMASQALRLDKAEEQGKAFMFSEVQLDQLCKNFIKEVKEAKESDMEQHQNWSTMIEEQLKNLHQGMDVNNDAKKSSIQQLGDTVAALQVVDAKIHSLTLRLDGLEQAAKGTSQSTTDISLETLNEKMEMLLADFEEQNEKLHSLDEENQQLKLMLQQTASAQASDLESLQKYCRDIRSDFEMKFLVDIGQMPIPEDELTPQASINLEAAVAEQQNRTQQKADNDTVNLLAVATQNTKEGLERMELSMIEVRSQIKRLSAGSRRASRSSVNLATEIPVVADMNMGIMEELTKGIQSTMNNHEKVMLKFQEVVGLLGKSILIMSGQNEKMEATSEVKRTEAIKNEPGTQEDALSITLHGALQEIQLPTHDVIKEASFGKLAEMDDIDSVVQAIDDALKLGKFEAKGNATTIAKVAEDLLSVSSRVNYLDSLVLSLKDILSGKADRIDLQKLLHHLKEVARPEYAMLSGRPLYGFKCMSCDHPLERLNTVPAEHTPTNRMPPQILPMLSAERIFSYDKRNSNGGAVSPSHSPIRTPRVRNGSFSVASPGVVDPMTTTCPLVAKEKWSRSGHAGNIAKTRAK